MNAEVGLCVKHKSVKPKYVLYFIRGGYANQALMVELLQRNHY